MLYVCEIYVKKIELTKLSNEPPSVGAFVTHVSAAIFKFNTIDVWRTPYSRRQHVDSHGFCWGDPEGREESWSKNFQPGDVCFFRYLIVVNASPSVLRSWDVDEKRGGLKRRGSDFSRACRHGIARDQKQEKAEHKIPFRVGLVGIPPQRLDHFALEGYFIIFPEMHDSFFIIFLGWVPSFVTPKKAWKDLAIYWLISFMVSRVRWIDTWGDWNYKTWVGVCLKYRYIGIIES